MAFKKFRRRPLIDSETQEATTGHCLTLDVASARQHGLSEKQIVRIFEAFEKIARRELAIARRRFPGRYKLEDGTMVFEGPCCVCDDGKKKEQLSGTGYCYACQNTFKNGKKQKRVWI